MNMKFKEIFKSNYFIEWFSIAGLVELNINSRVLYVFAKGVKGWPCSFNITSGKNNSSIFLDYA